MSFPKGLALTAVALFGVIAIAALIKKGNTPPEHSVAEVGSYPIEIELMDDVDVATDKLIQENTREEGVKRNKHILQVRAEELPDADRVEEFFNTREPKLPIVQTITYKRKVPWLKGRPAWVADYASHYKTSRHFIARSLNGKPDYDKQDVKDGDRFNVFREDKDVEFHLLVDLLLSKMLFFYIDKNTNERVLLKTYQVGLGRPEVNTESGYLTPLGKYTLGKKIAIYRPKTMSYHQGEKVEMVSIFGVRWIPFGEEISGCTAPAKGLGIHGLPLEPNEKGEPVEDRNTLGKYVSDGCIRLASKDIEELFSIIITKPTTIEIVKGAMIAGH